MNLTVDDQLMSPIHDFLGTKTPNQWLMQAKSDLEMLLLDHAHCERKAAGTALTLISRYPQHIDLVNKMSRLAREELGHFEQVLRHLKKRGIAFRNIPASRYAKGMRDHCDNVEPAKLLDFLITGAFIEARSCERFYALLPHLPVDIASFYTKLIHSEARHFEDYLTLANAYFPAEQVSTRVMHFRRVENDLVSEADPQFRFHSGVPVDA